MIRLAILFVCSLGMLSACEGRGTIDTNSMPSPPSSGVDAPTIDGEKPSTLQWFPDSFQVVLMRGNAPDPFVEGNSLDGFEA
ncbi:MAG: hypothetical protein ACNA8W_23100, partial [Bradymonadaceae bacterium]